MSDYPEPDVAVPSLSPRELYAKLRDGETISVLDVRDRDEVAAWRIDGGSVDAEQIPYVRFVAAEAKGEVAALAADLDLAEPVVAVCARGEASAYVAGLLREAGVEAVNLAGGMAGWARLLVGIDLPTDGVATVRQYVRPSSGCLSYLVAAGGEAAVVDPPRAFADRYVADADELGVDLVAAVDTHVHADHLSGVRAVAERTGAERLLPAGATERGLAFDATLLEDGDAVAVGDARIEALPAPGHTTEMTALRLDDCLLSGDSLFLESVARPDLERGAAGAADLAGTLYDSLQELLALPGDTVVAPGHVGPSVAPNENGGFAASLDAVREHVSILGLDREAFVERVLEDMPPRPANYEAIIAINLGRREADAEEGFELELGPNNCAVSAD